jgi:hypothetical protein
MAYTDVWDVTAPLDTQAANQGAVDFRATKLDVMQRIASFGAGLLANRPTPETTGATADWTGVMYWATDFVQVFQWAGSAWLEVTNKLLGAAASNALFVLPNDTALHTITSRVLPANVLTNSRGFAGELLFTATLVGADSLAIILSLGATNTTLATVVPNGTVTYSLSFSMINSGAPNLQQIAAVLQNTATGALTVLTTTTAVDTTLTQTIAVAAQKTGAAGAVAANFFNTYLRFT